LFVVVVECVASDTVMIGVLCVVMVEVTGWICPVICVVGGIGVFWVVVGAVLVIVVVVLVVEGGVCVAGIVYVVVVVAVVSDVSLLA